MNKSRFSMLLLEPGEIYFEDYSCKMNEQVSLINDSASQGRLKLCSKSLVFEPRDWALPLIKLHFKDCVNISTATKDSSGDTTNIIMVQTKQHAEMLEENILAPYKFRYEYKDFYFHFDFVTAEECLSQMQQLQRASTLHAPEHNSMVATILHSRYMRMVFDPVMMDDFTEQIICELQAEKISPLVRHQGKLALTPTTLYFQPFSNIECDIKLYVQLRKPGAGSRILLQCRLIGEFSNFVVSDVLIPPKGLQRALLLSPIIKLKLCDMKRIYKRRFLLRQVGLEIYSSEERPISHIYLTFPSEDARDQLFNTLEDSPNVKLQRVHTDEMTLQWQNGVVSNYDYLMYLNCLGDRSQNDLTQYPVFPWIIADYASETLDLDRIETFRDLSKPMGALNPDRLEKLKDRFNEMNDPKFLYGSHYSAPGLVLFYLVRKYPQYMLCLQNGRFDHPDRMFNSVKDVYNNCLNNMSDFKELVPEFYDTDAKGDFLINKYDIDFGERHDGTKVYDVKLPPWADSPEDFVLKLRDALESDYVSRHLHLWIDLIFGYKQRGENAVEANNVFHHVCYEGSVDLDCIYDMNDRHALEVQIMEFGQVPKQIFTNPHVRRIIQRVSRPIRKPDCCVSYTAKCIDTIKLHKESVNCVLRQGPRLISVSKDGTLKVYDVDQRKQIRSVSLSTTPLSSCVMVDEHVVAVGAWDNEIYLYDVEYGRVMESFRAHDDSVSCLLWLKKHRLLISGGSDCVVRVWGDVGKVGQALRGLRAEFDHDGKITCITYRYRHYEFDIIAGTSDGEVFVWDFRSKALLNKLCLYSTSVCGARFLSADRLVTVSGGGEMTVTDLSVLHSVYQKQFPEPISSLCCDGAGVLWLGSAAGALLQWNMIAVAQLDESLAHADTIKAVHFDDESKTLITASKDRSVKLWQLVPNS